MTITDFNQILQSRFKKSTDTLVIKGQEYQRNEDVFHNFNVGARITNSTREKVLWGFALKHYISFLDMLDDVEKGKLPSIEKIDEKIGDLINYLILCEASLKNRHDSEKNL